MTALDATTPLGSPVLSPRLVAHRGASAAAPENTIAAIRQAAGMGARWVEVDVSLLGDGTAVLHHDAELGRTSDADGPLSEISAMELATIDAGSWHSTAYAGERIPTLEAALDTVLSLGLGVNLELKPHDADPTPLANETAAVLAARPALAGRVVISSFDHEALEVKAEIAPAWPRAPIWHQAGEDWHETVLRLGAAAVHANARYLEPALIDDARTLGVPVRVFTVNDPVAAVGLRRMGVAAVITDVPDQFLADPAWAAWDAA